jgi:hypothetical protein
MNKLSIILAGVILLAGLTTKINARPMHRYDAFTKSCRNLTEGKPEWNSRVWGKGGDTFRKSCKAFHFRGNDKGASFLWVESKSSKGWNRVFASGYPKCAKDGSWKQIPLEQRLALNDYLFRFGKDTQDRLDNV